MTKKQDTTQTTFGIAARLPVGTTSLVRSSSVGSMNTALTSTEERMELEWHKQLFAEKLQGDKTRYGVQQIGAVSETAATEYHELIEQMKGIKQTFTGDEYDAYSDRFNHITAQMAAKHIAEAVDTGVGRIIEEISRPLYRKEEERKRILGLW
jgi:uncharacterized protein YukE